MPNPYGRSSAPMQEPKKDVLRRHIEELQRAIYVAESRREQAEQRLKEIERILSAPDQRPAIGCNEEDEVEFEAGGVVRPVLIMSARREQAALH
jgi:hypothetical protein